MGKDGLIADQRQCRAERPHIQKLRARPAGKAVALLRGEPVDPETRHQIAQRHIFAKGHKVVFVIDLSDRSIGIQHHQRIVIAHVRPALHAQSHRHVRGGSNLGHIQRPRDRSFGPDYQIRR